MAPSTTSGGVPRDGDASKPGGREADDAEGASSCRTLHAASLTEAAENGDREMCEGDTSPGQVSSRTGGQPHLDDGEEGQTPVGELGGSGVVGGVRSALERRREARGEAERSRERPRLKNSSPEPLENAPPPEAASSTTSCTAGPCSTSLS
jgi:hypothetical protein